jgi:hypothetical protein
MSGVRLDAATEKKNARCLRQRAFLGCSVDGDIRLDPINSKTRILLFTYYLNPTPNDRNLEFDPKRNLFTNLKDEERVTAP